MARTFPFVVAVLSAVLGVVQSAGQTIAGLEERLGQIAAELDQLSVFTLRGGIGPIGFHSRVQSTADHGFWIEIELDRVQLIDQVVLVPVLWSDSEGVYRADAFPPRFRVLAGTGDRAEAAVLADYRSSEPATFGTAPVVLPVPPTQASWVRFEFPELARRLHDDRYVLQFSEIMVFSGLTNVALKKPVRLSSPKPPDPSGAWDERFLVDGSLPYLMNSQVGAKSVAFVSNFGEQPNLIIDLGQPQSISEVHLHAVEQGDVVPQAFPGDLGIPRHFRIEGSTTEDFREVDLLLDYRWRNIADTSPIMMWDVPETRCRYVRLVVVEPSVSYGIPERLSRVGFAEIELFSKGTNVAREARVWADPPNGGQRQTAALTDGRNVYGEIIPIRAWMTQLARRQALETERSEGLAQLDRLYARQSVVFSWLIWTTVILAFGVVATIFFGRVQRAKRESDLRQRIAANLHDELGANIHALGLLSDIALESTQQPDRLADAVQRIRG